MVSLAGWAGVLLAIIITQYQVNISGLYLVLRLADQNHIADDMPHAIVSHIVAELQVLQTCHRASPDALVRDNIPECYRSAASNVDAAGTPYHCCL